MPTRHVYVTDLVEDDLAIERHVLGDLAVVEACGAKAEQDLVGRVDGADALMVYHLIEVSAATIDRLAHCKLIVRCGVGYDNVDLAAATARGIPVANVPDYGTEEVADSAIGMMLALTRGIHRLNVRMQIGEAPWTYGETVPLTRLRGEVLGIVGLGRIGTAVALRAKALGMEVVFYDPYQPAGLDKALGIRRVEALAQLLEQSYVVSLHCPSTTETRHMIGAHCVGVMRRGAYLINTARGDVVDTSVIPDAIASGQLAGAAIDVLPEEPPPDDSPLLIAWRDPQHPAHDRLIINPHAAFYCEEGLTEIRVKASQACRAALTGQPIRTRVN
jgi:D-3-phosphoglycerate dehydrogenase/C-terminal binding protein